MPSFRLSRRAMLRGAGAVVALPLLEAMLDSRGRLWSGTARASGPTVPVRLILMYFPNGSNMAMTGDTDLWTPNDANNRPLARTAQGGYFRSFPTMQAFPVGQYTLSPSLQGLQPIQSDVAIIAGLENVAVRSSWYSTIGQNPGCSHHAGYRSLYTGMPPDGSENVTGPTFDQFVLRDLGYDTATPKFPSISVGHPINPDPLCWSAPGAPVSPYTEPARLFSALFPSGGASATSSSMTNTAGSADDQSVLDYVAGSVTSLKARLGANDQMMLDQHLASIRAVELASMIATTTTPTVAAASCSMPTAPAAAWNPPFPTAGLPDTRDPEMLRLLMLALQCDLTRVVSFCVSQHTAYTYSWIPTTTLDRHSMSHLPDQYGSVCAPVTASAPCTGIQAANQWEVQQFVNFVQALKATPDVDGNTMLYNSIVLMCTEVADGQAHNYVNLPCLMAGNAGGRLNTGQYIMYPWSNNADTQVSVGTSLAGLMCTIMQAMGSSVQTFGVDSAGALPGLLA